jgi:hypothetical protein
MLARKANNNDSYSFFSKIDFSDKAVLNSYRREFLDHVKSRTHGDFDRGFFSAWSDCMRVLGRMNIADTPKANSVTQEKKELISDSEKSQVTIEEFIEEKD